MRTLIIICEILGIISLALTQNESMDKNLINVKVFFGS